MSGKSGIGMAVMAWVGADKSSRSRGVTTVLKQQEY